LIVSFQGIKVVSLYSWKVY